MIAIPSLLPALSPENLENEGRLDQFVVSAPTVSSSFQGSQVKEIFDKEAEIEGVVVLDNQQPVGLIMRSIFYQKIGAQYGHSLYMGRPVSILMETALLTVDVNDNISKIGIQSMSREQSKLYDYVLVYKNGTYIGVISIRRFLVDLAQRNEAQISVLKSKQKELLDAHEQEITLRRNLEYQSVAVKNLLDHADQGFLSFAEDLIVTKEFSDKCTHIFSKNIAGTNYLHLTASFFDDEKTAVFKAVFQNYFVSPSPVMDHVFLSLLPADCIIGDRSIHFKYKRIESNGKKAIMVVLDDISDRVAMEKALEEDRAKQRLLIKAFSAQSQIKQLLADFTDLFSCGYGTFFDNTSDFKAGLTELFRSVHTYKGDFAQHGFTSTSAQLHIFEDKIQQLLDDPAATMSDVTAVMEALNPSTVTEQDLSIISGALGEGYLSGEESILLDKNKLQAVIDALSGPQHTSPQETLKLVRRLKNRNIKDFIFQYEDYLKYLSARLMKSEPAFVVEGSDIEIDPDHYNGILKSLVHLLRNSMDHGIEPGEQRVKNGKPECGLIRCETAFAGDDTLILTISDDGQGIDLQKLKDKALQKGLYSCQELDAMTDARLAELVFADNMSTKDAVSSLSGRGVGMCAVLAECRHLGGKITVSTQQGLGTTFRISLPLFA